MSTQYCAIWANYKRRLTPCILAVWGPDTASTRATGDSQGYSNNKTLVVTMATVSRCNQWLTPEKFEFSLAYYSLVFLPVLWLSGPAAHILPCINCQLACDFE